MTIELASSFLEYCKQHPTERFWQALRNWSGHNFIGISDADSSENAKYEDSFYRETL